MLKTSVAAVVIAGCLALSAWLPTTAVAQVEFFVSIAPPPLPVYDQPPIPAPGYLWVPGYWSYGPFGYFWVPGTWVESPAIGLLWTPGYWGWSDGLFVWYPGYWAPQIGFYGGVNYGFGYPGHGYEGGYWRGNQFFYNRVVNNVTNVVINNVYSKTVASSATANRVSYVGGPGGLTARPTVEEQQVMHEHHTPPTAAQVQHRETAAARPELVASVNHGKPEIAATSQPNNFDSHVLSASSAGGPVPVHAQELPKLQVAPPPAKAAASAEQEYQRQLSALQARQQQEREALAQMQERDHAYLAQQNGNARALAAMEHQHHQQTQFMQQRQANEIQNLRPSGPHAPKPSAPPPRH